MLIEATSQTLAGPVYVLNGNDDLNVAAGVTLFSLTSDAILTNSGQHSITISGTVLAYDDAINTIGCEAPQTIVIAASGTLIAGAIGSEPNADGVILDGIGSTLVNNGTILATGSGLSLFVRDAGTTTVTNNGYINGDLFGIWNKFGTGVLNVTNTGVIESAGAAYFGGIGTDNVTNLGSFKGDVLLNAGNDLYLGQGGVVFGLIHGGDGDDRFVLGNAPDKVDGGYGFDTLDFSGVTEALVIDLANSSFSLGAPAVGDTYTNIEAVIGSLRADILRGNAADNTFYGSCGTDSIFGYDGQDTLVGDNGKDVLTGGAGADLFVFFSRAHFGDQITDFETGTDLIRIEGSAIDLGTYAGGLDASRFHSGTSNAAGDLSDRLIFNTTNATLWYDKDGTGTKFSSIMIADLQDGVVLTAASIDVI